MCDEGQTPTASSCPSSEQAARAFPEVLLNGGMPMMMQMMYPPPPPPPPGVHHQSGGIYVVPSSPLLLGGGFGGGAALIPLTYNIPTIATGAENDQSNGSPTQLDTGRGSPAGAPAPEGLHQHNGAPARDAQEQRHDNQRQLVRRFQVGFQLDLLLMLKLAVVVFVFNQDGSKERLFLLLSLATLVYLYQTGALAPLLRWISDSARRARLPPHPPARVVNPQHAARPEGLQEAGNEPYTQNVERQDLQEVPNDRNGPADRVNQGAVHLQGLNWWGFVKEVQMVVVGFLMSLLPGFHHHAD